MSSSSSEPDAAPDPARPGSVQDLLARSLDAIHQNVPEQHLALCTAVDGLDVRLELDHETFTVRGVDGIIVLSNHGPVPCVKLTTATRTVLAIADGKLDLLDSVLDEGIRLSGTIKDLLRFDDVLLAYLHGAVRCPTSSNLLAEFRTLSAQRHSMQT